MNLLALGDVSLAAMPRRWNTCHAHESAETTRVASTHHTAKLLLHQELHDGLSGGSHGVLLVALGRTARLVKELEARTSAQSFFEGIPFRSPWRPRTLPFRSSSGYQLAIKMGNCQTHPAGTGLGSLSASARSEHLDSLHGSGAVQYSASPEELDTLPPIQNYHSRPHAIRVHVPRLSMFVRLLVLPLNSLFVDVIVVGIHVGELGEGRGEQRGVLVTITVGLVGSFEGLVVVDWGKGQRSHTPSRDRRGGMVG